MKQAERARGDVPLSILCYMREADVSEEIAQKHIEDMINKCWKKINGQCFNQLPMLQSFVNIVTNNARVAHSLYQYGDGFGIQDRDTRKNIVSLLVEPLVLYWIEMSNYGKMGQFVSYESMMLT